MAPQGVVGPGITYPPLASSGFVASVSGSAPIKVTPTTGSAVVSWLPTATVSMNTQKLGHLTTPTTATQAANKSYVDGLVQGLNAKTSAVASAIANVATLSGAQTIDGVALVAGNRALLTGQTTAKTNGLWVVQTGAWTRPTTFAAGSSQQGSYVLVEEGTARSGTGWVLTGTAIVVGTTNQTWVKFSSATAVTMGGGVTGTSTNATVAKAPSGSLVAGVGIGIVTTAGKGKISATTVTLVTKTTAWTAALTTGGKLVSMNNAAGKTVTIPKHATVAWPTGTVILFRQAGAGQLTVAAGATVTLHSPTAKVKTRVQYSTISATYLGSTVWSLAGDLG